MSDNYIHEEQNQEHPGFNSVLLINLENGEFISNNPKTDIPDSVDSLNLSIESSSNEEKRKGESHFMFCLSRDLLNMLEEDSIPNCFEDGEENEVQSKVASDYTAVQNETEKKNEEFTAEEKNVVENKESNVISEVNYREISSKEHGEEKKDIGDSFNCKGDISDSYRQQQTAFGFQAFFYWQKLIQHSITNKCANFPYNKPGWTCLSCKNYNYEVRIKCNRCGQPKSDEYNRKPISSELTQMTNDSKPVNLSPTSNPNLPPNANTGTVSESKKKKKPFVERAGDWNCFKCKNLNFSFRTICNRCQLLKKDSEKSYEEYMKNAMTYVKINEIIQNKQFHDYNVNKSEKA